MEENELENLPSISMEDARCWNCGSVTYRGGETDSTDPRIFKVISCTDCRPGGEAELEKALKEALHVKP